MTLRGLSHLLAIDMMLALGLFGASTAHGQNITISMEAPPPAPQLHGPFVYGAVSAAPFVFAVPATGAAPLSFAASDLPEGLMLDAGTGIISGTTPAAGSYPVTVTVTNAEGSANAEYTIESGSTLALTPPMGWNSYDSFGASVTEQDMLDQADAVREVLQPFGWNYVVIDYRWYEPGQPIDDNGRYLPATSKYPSATGSNGFKSLADQIHARGLGFGIHIMRGVPRKSYDANLTIAGSTYTTRDAGNTSDPCPWDDHMWGVRGDTAAGQAWYDALFAQYAEWGVDFVKIDDMLNNSTKDFHQAEADAIKNAVDKTGRSIVLSFSPGPDDPSWLPNSAASLNKNANMWRVVNDFWDYNALTDLPGVFREAEAWQGVTTLTPGHWADLDMLPLGYLGPRNEWHASGQTQFGNNEQVTIMTLWSMLPSPLMFGGNPERLSSDDWTRALLTNPEVLAVNQDVLGARGKRIDNAGNTETWVRELSTGGKAVAFFNRGQQNTEMSATFDEMGVTGMPVVRDVWQRTETVVAGDMLTAEVPGGSALMFTLTPPVEGTGGMGGAGGSTSTASTTDGVGGAATTSSGGAAGSTAAITTGTNGTSATVAGATTTTSGATSMGITSTTGTSSSSDSSGTSGVLGSTSTGTAGAGNNASASDDSGGCGCGVPGQRRAPDKVCAVFALALVAFSRRRRHATS